MLNSEEPCRVCTSRYTLYVQDVVGRRTQNKFPQRFCMDCHSFVHTSNYSETLEQQLMDYEELQRQRDHHSKLQYQLALELYTRRPHTRTVLEIGHGLGLFLRATADSFAATQAYLRPDPARVEAFKRRYAALGPGPVIGIAWQSKSTSHRRKSLALDDFAPLFQALPHATFISLQYGDTADEIAHSLADVVASSLKL